MQNPMGFAAHEAGSINNIGTTSEYRLNDSRNFLRIVLQVGVLNDDDVSSCYRKACSHRRALSWFFS